MNLKKWTSLFIAASCAFFSFAGDAAFFDDIGFSEDGKFYLFGQYGKIDKIYEPWAEIYTVDVEKNDFVKGEVYKITSKDVKNDVSGKKAYETLKAKNQWKTAKYNAKPADVNTLLYLRESETKSPLDEIVFKDFEGSALENPISYHVQLVPTYEGSGVNVRSKFYIKVQRVDSEGNVLTNLKAGTPDFMRKGITAYQIDKIFTDKTGKNLVFIVQKTLEDEKGISIRYMVETLVLK